MEDEVARLEQTQRESLFYLNMIKNAQSVYVGDDQVLTRLYTGQKIFVAASDISVSPALMLDGMWEPEVTKNFTSLLRPSDTLIDVGANMGYFGLIAGTVIRADAGGRIDMIEANPRLVPLIYKSIHVSGLLSVASVANFAVSDKSGELELQVVRHLLGSSAIEDLEANFAGDATRTSTVVQEVLEKATVRAVTLDEYAEMESLGKVDVVKIDVEGHEEKVYAGMAKVIEENGANLRVLIEFSVVRCADPPGFFQQIQEDFKFIYAIEHGSGALTEVARLDDVTQLAGDDWIMLVAANEHAETP